MPSSPSPLSNKKWIIIAFLTHSTWGMHPVVSRYLQVISDPPMDSNVLLVLGKTLSVLVLGLLSFYSTYTADKSEEATILLSSSSSSSSSSASSSPRTSTSTWSIEKIKYALLFSTFATIRATTNMKSCELTLAYNIALVNAFTPFIAAFLEKCVLKTDLPPGLITAAFCTTAASILIGYAQSTSTDQDGSLTKSDLLGVSLQFISLIASNCARLIMKTSKDILTSNEVVQLQNVSTVLFALILAYFTVSGGELWTQIEALYDLQSLLSFLFLSIPIFSLAAITQVSSIRILGPAVYGGFSSLRVVVAVFVSWVWLGEGVESWLEWVGIGIVCVSLTVFAGEVDVGFKRGKDKGKDKGEEEGDARGGNEIKDIVVKGDEKKASV